MTKSVLAIGLFAALAGIASAQEGAVPKDIPHLDHVFYIMMENHGYRQIINNPNAPFVNSYAADGQLATNYYAVAHPSLTNYLEAVGGSNFGVHSDNDPDFHNGSCATNLSTGIANTDNPASSAICPIAGTGTDAATPVIDCTNEVTAPPCEINVDGRKSYDAVSTTLGITIADQIVTAGKSWKTYQESLPLTGPDLVTYSDGNFSNLTDFTKMNPQLDPPLTSDDIVKLYAAKQIPLSTSRMCKKGRTRSMATRTWWHSTERRACGAIWARGACRTSCSSFPTSATISTGVAMRALSAILIPTMMEHRRG